MDLTEIEAVASGLFMMVSVLIISVSYLLYRIKNRNSKLVRTIVYVDRGIQRSEFPRNQKMGVKYIVMNGNIKKVGELI